MDANKNIPSPADTEQTVRISKQYARLIILKIRKLYNTSNHLKISPANGEHPVINPKERVLSVILNKKLPKKT